MEEDRQLCFNKMMFTSCNKSIHQTTKGKLIWQHESGILPISMAVMCFMLMIQLCEFVCECRFIVYKFMGEQILGYKPGSCPRKFIVQVKISGR